MSKGEKILITGITSQVAWPIARALVRDYAVYGLSRFRHAAQRARLEALGVTCIPADLASDALEAVPEDVRYVLNFAVLRTDSFDLALAANAESVGRLMWRTRHATAWLHCSSMRVYQYKGQLPLLEDDPLGDQLRGPGGGPVAVPTYSLSKIAAEVLARFGARQWQIPTTIARLSVPYGDNGGWPARHLEALLAGEPIPVHRQAPNTYNPIHEDDYVAHIPRLLAAASVPATVINWGGEAVSVEAWCTYMGRLLGIEPRFLSTPHALASMVLDRTRMQRLIGDTRVNWHDGLRRLIRARHPELPLRG